MGGLLPWSQAAGRQRQELLVTNDQLTLTAWQVASVNIGSQGNGLGKQVLPVLNIGCEHRKHSHGALAHRPPSATSQKKSGELLSFTVRLCVRVCSWTRTV